MEQRSQELQLAIAIRGTRHDSGRDAAPAQDLLLAAFAPGALSSVLNVAIWRKLDNEVDASTGVRIRS
jgi:hypothetical protein